MRKRKDLRVTLQALRCTNAEGDSGANLEIFGDIEARGVTINAEAQPVAGFRKTLWSRSEDAGGVNIAPNTEIPVNRSVNFPVFDRDFLWLGGRIVEEDDFDDDTLGDGFRIIRFENINSEMINVGFNNDNQEILARFTVEVLRTVDDPNA
jgi:hypothetical protein